MQHPILIVDDETKIRAGLCHMITAHFGAQFVLYEAENAFDAFHILENDHVEVVITDVKMPGMSGIELMEKAQAAQLAAKFIVISGFDDYSLVRGALRAGALDYLLKPISLADVIAQLEAVLKSLETETAEGTLDTASISTYQQQLWVEALMQGGEAERLSALQQAGIPPHYLCGLCIIAVENKQYSEKHVYEQKLHALARRYGLLDTGFVISGYMKHGYVFLKFMEEAARTQAFTDFHQALTDGHYFHSAQCQYMPQSQLVTMIEACVRDMERSFYDLPRQDVLGETTEDDVSTIVLEYLQNPDEEIFVKQVNATFYRLNDGDMKIAAIKKYLCESFYQLMNRDHSFILIIGQYKLSDFDIIEAIQCAEHLSALRVRFLEILSVYIAEYWTMHEEKEDVMIRKMKAYIDQNYSVNVQLADLARHVHLHPNYLSTVFKEKTGVCFRDYLREVRVEKAKHLLDHSALKIYEIALEVGYTEPAHFNRAFKTVVGVAPQAWKSMGDTVGLT